MNNAIECKICGNTGNNKVYQVKEMQLGLRELFEYLHCGKCGCMQLLNAPADFSRYYPNEEYYSFAPIVKFLAKPDYLRMIKADYLIHGRQSIVGKLLSIGYKKPDYYNWMKVSQIEWDDKILDVGCGNGRLLLHLYKIGFTNLTGIDPFIKEEKKYGDVKILKKDIFQLEETYDYIMLNHSFEHMDEPLKVMQRLKELVLPKKHILIRTPLTNMYGWKTYGLDWLALDAPRHIFIHTVESIQILAEKVGLEIKKVVFDTDPINIIMSEQYKKDIAMSDPASFIFLEKSSYRKKLLESARRVADKINEDGEGDQACFYLYKPK